MKKAIQNAIVYAIFASGLGAIIYSVALVLRESVTEESKGVLVWVAASAVIGLISLLYECESLTDLQATLIHAPLTFLTALIAGSILNYGEGSVMLLLARMLPVIVVVYVFVHLLMFLLRRQSVKSVNNKLSGK
ncbi:MAG: DUF3021 family protein [Butyricicoccus sp.]